MASATGIESPVATVEATEATEAAEVLDVVMEGDKQGADADDDDNEEMEECDTYKLEPWDKNRVSSADDIERGKQVNMSFKVHLNRADRELMREYIKQPFSTVTVLGVTGFHKYHMAVDIAAIIVAESGFKWPVSPKFHDKVKKDKRKVKKSSQKHDPSNKPECSIFSPLFFLYCKWWRELPDYMYGAQIEELDNRMRLFVEYMRILYSDRNKMNNQYCNLVRYIAWRKQNNQDLALSTAFVMKQFVDQYAEFLKENRAIVNERTGRKQVSPTQASLHSRAVFQVFQPLMMHQGYLEDSKSLIATLPCKTGMKRIRQVANERAKEDHQGSTNSALNTAKIIAEDEELFVDTLWRAGLSSRSDADQIRCASAYITLSRWGARGQNIRLCGLNSISAELHGNKETPMECFVVSSVQRIGKNCDASGSARVKENTFHTIHTSDIRYDALVAWAIHMVYHADVENIMFRRMEACLTADLNDEETEKWNTVTPMFPTEEGASLTYQRHSNYMKKLYELNPERLHTKVTHSPRYTALDLLMANSGALDAIANILKFQHATTMNSVYAKGAMAGSELFILSMWRHEAEYAPWWFDGRLDKHDIPQLLWDAVAPEFDRIHGLAQKLREQGKDEHNVLMVSKVLCHLKLIFLESSVWLRPEYPDRVMYSSSEIFRDPKLCTEWNTFALRHTIRSLAKKHMLRTKFPDILIREWPLPTDCIPRNRWHPAFRIREERIRTINIFPKIEKLCATCCVGVDYFIHLAKEMGHADILKHVLPSTLPLVPAATSGDVSGAEGGAVDGATASKATAIVPVSETKTDKTTALARLTPFPEHFENLRHVWDLWVHKYKRMYAEVQTPRGIPWKAIGNEGMKLQYHKTIDFLNYTENELQVFRTDLSMADRTDLYFKTLETFRTKANDVSTVSWVRQHFYFTMHACKSDSKDYKQMEGRGCTPEQLRALFRSAGLTVPELRETRPGGRKAKSARFTDEANETVQDEDT